MKKVIRVIKKIFRGENPLIVRYETEKWEDQFRRGYWDFLLDTPYNVAVTAMMVNQYARKAGKSISVLDVGCGNGALVRELNRTEIAYTGTDISTEALKEAKKLAPEGTYVEASMNGAPPLEGQFDVIVFSEVLLYGDYKNVLKIHTPFLKPDGLLIVSLYDTWRTKIMWRFVKKQLSILESVYVINQQKKIGWTIVAGKYKA